MKRLLMVCVAIVSIFAIGCEKEDVGLDKRLVGTKWASWSYGGRYDIYEFINARQVENYSIENGIVVSNDGTFDYELDYPNLSIYRINYKGERYALEYYFRDAKTFIRKDADSEWGCLMKYTKQ